MNIEHLSVSRAQLNFTCKYKYKLKYHLKVPSPIKEYPWFLYGKIIHKIIEVYTVNRGKLLIGDISQEILKNEEPLSFNYKMQLKDDLISFVSLSNKIGYDGEIEVAFNKDLDPPNNKSIVGVIDRVIERNGNYYIFDWKTTKQGKHQKTAENILHDLQLRVYANIISSQMNVDAAKIKCALYYMQGSKLVSASFSQKTLDEVPSKMLKIYNEIASEDPNSVVGSVGDHCGICEYNSLCPFYKSL